MTAVLQQHTSIADAYIRHGWKLVGIEPGTKGPTGKGWNSPENALQVGQLPPGWNVGLLHALSNTMAFDIDNIEKARQFIDEYAGVPGTFDRLFSAPDAVGIDSGNPGHAKLLYRMPLGMAMPSKRFTADKRVIFELRCGTANGKSAQDVLPPSRHPRGSIYQWVGNGHWQRLPELPEVLQRLWAERLAADSQRNIQMGEGVTPASFDEVRDALYAIPADCGREEWIEVGMALNHLGVTSGQEQAMFMLWDEWSSDSREKYNARDTAYQWSTFQQPNNGITIATLFHHAKQHGWRRPVPDLEGLFRPVESEITVQQVRQQITPDFGTPAAPLDLFPPVLVRRAQEIAHEVGCDVAVPLMAGLAAVSGATDKRIKLSITPTWKVPPVLWLMLIGDPSVKKSPGSRPMFRILRQLEHEDTRRYETEMLLWLGKEARYAAEAKAYREWAASPESSLPGSVPPTVTPLPPQPESLRMIVTDSTSQKLVSLAQNRPRGFLIWMDELHKWLCRQNDQRSSEDRGCWIQAYETGRYTMDRMGAGTIHADNLAASMLGNVQPDVFRDQLGRASVDGMMQRFLPVVLDSRRNKLWEMGRPDFMSSEPEYDAMIRTCYSLHEFEYVLSPGALAAFRTFCQWMINFREAEKANNYSSTYSTSLGKLEGVGARLILLFHLIEQPHCPFVSEDTAKRAITAIHRYFLPMMRYAYLDLAGQRDDLGKRTFDTILQLSGEKTTITLAELRAVLALPRDSQTDTRLRIIMDDLTAFGYVWMHQDHPRFPTWAINPAMAQHFAAERKNIVCQKQLLVKMLHQNVFEDTGRVFNVNAIGFTEETQEELLRRYPHNTPELEASRKGPAGKAARKAQGIK